jgi:hypothetical protein
MLFCNYLQRFAHCQANKHYRIQPQESTVTSFLHGTHVFKSLATASWDARARSCLSLEL